MRGFNDGEEVGSNETQSYCCCRRFSGANLILIAAMVSLESATSDCLIYDLSREVLMTGWGVSPIAVPDFHPFRMQLLHCMLAFPPSRRREAATPTSREDKFSFKSKHRLSGVYQIATHFIY